MENDKNDKFFYIVHPLNKKLKIAYKLEIFPETLLTH